MEKTERKGGQEGRRERECLASTATAAAACQDEKRGERRRQREEKRRLQDCLRGAVFMYLSAQGKGFDKESRFLLFADALLYGLMQEACLEIV